METHKRLHTSLEIGVDHDEYRAKDKMDQDASSELPGGERQGSVKCQNHGDQHAPGPPLRHGGQQRSLMIVRGGEQGKRKDQGNGCPESEGEEPHRIHCEMWRVPEVRIETIMDR